MLVRSGMSDNNQGPWHFTVLHGLKYRTGPSGTFLFGYRSEFLGPWRPLRQIKLATCKLSPLLMVCQSGGAVAEDGQLSSETHHISHPFKTKTFPGSSSPASPCFKAQMSKCFFFSPPQNVREESCLRVARAKKRSSDVKRNYITFIFMLTLYLQDVQRSVSSPFTERSVTAYRQGFLHWARVIITPRSFFF